MPWSSQNPPRPAKNWPGPAKALCVRVANGVLRSGGSDQDAIYACISAVKKRYPSAIKTPKSKQRHEDATARDAVEFSHAFYEIPEIELQEDNGRYSSSFQVLPEGKFVHPWYGDLDFTAPILRAFKRHFDQNVLGTDIMVDEGHNRGKALGWFRQLHHGTRKIGEQDFTGLFADVEWTPLGRDFLEQKIYKYFSAEVGSYTGPDGNKVDNVLLGGGLTNRPFFKQMPAVKFDDEEGQREDRFVIGLFTDDHWQFSQPTAPENSTTFSAHYHDREDLEEGDDKEVAMDELLESINQTLGTQFADGDEAVTALAEMRTNADIATKFRTTFSALGFEFSDDEDPVAAVAREFKAMKDNNSSLDNRLQAVEGRLAEAEFEVVFSDNLRVGKVTPAQKNSMLKLFKSDRALFNDLMKDQQAVVQLGEVGHTGAGGEPGSEGDHEFRQGSAEADAETKRYLGLVGGRKGGN